MPLDGSLYETAATRWLVEGKETLLRCGWKTGAWRGQDGTVCMMWALPLAARVQPDVQRVNAILVEAIAQLGYGRYSEAYYFNDHPGRTLGEVMDVYDLAIEISRRDHY